jgi:superfamily II DNA helicase RecQ
VPVLLLSATVPKLFEGELWKCLGLSDNGSTPHHARVLRESTLRQNISYQVMNLDLEARQPGREASDGEKAAWLEEWTENLSDIIDEHRDALEHWERGLVFFSEKEFAQELAGRVNLPVITGDSKQEDRDGIWGAWHMGTSPIIATNKAGYYGVDYPHVAFTIHIDRPRSMLDFVQSSGRAGRGGGIARSLVLLPFVTAKPSKWEMGLEETFSGVRAIKDMLRSECCYCINLAEFLDGEHNAFTNMIL